MLPWNSGRRTCTRKGKFSDISFVELSSTLHYLSSLCALNPSCSFAKRIPPSSVLKYIKYIKLPTQKTQWQALFRATLFIWGEWGSIVLVGVFIYFLYHRAKIMIPMTLLLSILFAQNVIIKLWKINLLVHGPGQEIVHIVQPNSSPTSCARNFMSHLWSVSENIMLPSLHWLTYSAGSLVNSDCFLSLLVNFVWVLQ